MELKSLVCVLILISICYLILVLERLLKDFREIRQEISSIEDSARGISNGQIEVIYILKDILMHHEKTNDTSTVFSFEAYREEYERKARGE